VNTWTKLILGGLVGATAWRALGPDRQQRLLEVLNTWVEETNKKRLEEERQKELPSIAQTEIEMPRKPLPTLLALAAPDQPKPPSVLEPDAKLRDVIFPPAVVLVLGKRGSGKSALAYRILELFRYRLIPYVVGAPEKAGKLLPDWIGTVPSLEDLPPECIALVDEAYLHYHSRRSMAKESTDMSRQLNLSRQRNQTLIFVSQEARQLDRNIVSSANVVIFKELGMLQPEFDRPELRKLVEQANKAMAGLGKEAKKWAYVYSPDADYLGLLESQLPSFWKPALSKVFGAGGSTSAPRVAEKMTPKEKAVRALELKAKGYSYTMIMKELGVSKATVVNYLKGYPYRLQ